jgi:hypothetical protein
MTSSTPPQDAREPEWSHPNPIIAEVDPDELFEQWAAQDRYEEERQRAERFSVGRHPLLLLLVFVMSCSLAYRSYPAFEGLLRADETVDCGRVIDRAIARGRGAALPSYEHLQNCELEGVVQQMSLFAIGYYEDPEERDMFLKNKGVSYVVKLSGDKVFAILPAHQPWVEGYRLKEGSLVGLSFKTKGLMIQPDEEPVYQRLAEQVRVHFQIKREEQLWLFDVSYDPWDHKMPLITFALSPLLALLSLLGIAKSFKRRRSAQTDLMEEL